MVLLVAAGVAGAGPPAKGPTPQRLWNTYPLNPPSAGDSTRTIPVETVRTATVPSAAAQRSHRDRFSTSTVALLSAVVVLGLLVGSALAIALPSFVRRRSGGWKLRTEGRTEHASLAALPEAARPSAKQNVDRGLAAAGTSRRPATARAAAAPALQAFAPPEPKETVTGPSPAAAAAGNNSSTNLPKAAPSVTDVLIEKLAGSDVHRRQEHETNRDPLKAKASAATGELKSKEEVADQALQLLKTKLRAERGSQPTVPDTNRLKEKREPLPPGKAAASPANGQEGPSQTLRAPKDGKAQVAAEPQSRLHLTGRERTRGRSDALEAATERAVTDKICAIHWWRGYMKSQFDAVDADGRAVTSSAAFRWSKSEPPPVENAAATRALAELVDRLASTGWVQVGCGDRWFELRFVLPEARHDGGSP